MSRFNGFFRLISRYQSLGWLPLLFISCTIIEDTDITSAEQLGELKLQSLEILQETKGGNQKTTLTQKYDSIVDIIDTSTGARITRKVGYDLPSLGNFKMKLRSASSTNTTVTISFKDDTQPYTFRIYQGDSVIELYRFRYDASNRLNMITTLINPIDNKPPLFQTTDLLSYAGDNVTSLIRTSPDPTKSATINIQYGGSGNGLSVSSFNYLGVNYGQLQGNCPNGSSANDCTGYLVGPIQLQGIYSSYTISTNHESDILNQIRLEDSKINGGSGGRDYDTYYFHPLMMIRDQLNQGNFLLVIYALDWLVQGPTLAITNFTQNESVSINFKYGY